ncbi:MAG: L-threonylcarbamoyladenylate synthase [Limisphaerales bacterium]|jgi:L-threonylcarbamoyladenylate synthase
MSVALKEAAAVIVNGGVVLHATEGVWGFACAPTCEAAVLKILQMKQRSIDKGLLLIGSEAAVFDTELRAHVLREDVLTSWPGPHTWVLPNSRFPLWVTGGRGTVACRVPGHRQARCLSKKVGGALVSTSANRSGEAPAVDELSAREQFEGEIDYVLSGQVSSPGQVSTIYDMNGEVIR